MNVVSRRKLIKAGLGATAGLSGLAAAGKLADVYGLIPPTTGSLYAPGETLTYAAQRLLTRNSMAREFAAAEISTSPFANSKAPDGEEYAKLQAAGFSGWRLRIEGAVSRPQSLSIDQLRSYPSSSQITQLICEEGWSFIAKWTGVPLAFLLERAGALPNARYVAYFSLESGGSDSIDMADALHPQTFVTYAMNGRELPVGHGGPLRLRVPRQLGYKSLKFLNRLVVTDSLKSFAPQGEYSWYAGM